MVGCVQRFIAKHFAAHPALVEGKNVIEFGAASYVRLPVLCLPVLLSSRVHCALQSAAIAGGAACERGRGHDDRFQLEYV